MCNCTSRAQVNELSQRHCGDCRKGILFSWLDILCLFYFCTIWAVWALWITYDKSLKLILCSFLRAWWRVFDSLVSPMSTAKPLWWYWWRYLRGHTVFMIIFCFFNIHSNTSGFGFLIFVYIYIYIYIIYMMDNNIHDGYRYTKTCKEQRTVNKNTKISE